MTKDLDCSVSPDAVIDITAGSGYPGYTYEVSFNGGAFSGIAGSTFTTTTAGDYTFRVTDTQGCQIVTNVVTVTPAENPQATAAITQDVSCAGGSDGIVTINIDTNFGTPGYEISFDGSAFSTQTVYAGLAPGTYTYTVRDSKECTFTDTVTLNPATPITATAEIAVDYTCLTDGSITIQGGTAAGGTGTYEYSLDGVNFQASPTFAGLTDGTYTITVRDVPNGCTIVTNAVTLDPLNAPTDLSFASAPIICPALVTDVTVTVTDGNAPFVYEITAPAGSVVNNGNNNVFTGLGPGTYTIQVTDAKGCTITESYTVDDIVPISVTAQLVSDEVCFGAADGSLSFTVSNFAGSYDYEVLDSGAAVVANGTSSNTTETITGLGPDTYTVRVVDLSNPFCTDTSSAVVISGPPAALTFTQSLDPLTCISDAVLTITAADGWGGYEYQLDDTGSAGIDFPYQNGNVFAGLTAGTYTVFVRDTRGCEVTQPLTITAPVAPTVTIAPDTFCYDVATGVTITATPAGGVAPYEYSLNGGAFQSSASFGGLTPGTYTVTVRDDFGCTGTSNTITINDALTASAVLTKDLDCSVSPDAVIDITAGSGYPGYTYEVSFNGGAFSGIAGSTFTTTTAGDYTFRVTDTQGCQIVTNPVTVTPADLPVINNVVPTDVLCNGDLTGALDITIDTTIGVPPYVINVVNTTTATNFGTQTNGLPAGNYEVTVTDAKGCTSVPFPVTIAEPNALDITVVGNPLTCTPVGNQLGSVDITITTGSTPNYTYYLLDNTGALAATSTANPTGPTAATNLTFADVDFGDYTVRIVDANGCEIVRPVTVATGPDVLITTSGAAGCTVGSGSMLVEAQASNGTLGVGNFFFAIYPAPPFSPAQVGITWFAADPSPPAASPNTFTFTGLNPGVTYTFIVHDDDTNCEFIQEATVPVANLSGLTSSVTPTDVSCFGAADGNVSFTFDNFDAGATSVDYEIFTALTNVSTGITGNSTVNPPAGPVAVNNFGALAPGEYYIVFTENGGVNNGCVAVSTNFIIQQAPALLTVSATSPVNDNCNPNAGVITATAQAGVAPYEYQFLLATDPAPTATSPGWGTANTANVESGNYIVYVRDASNCVQASAPVTVDLDPSPVISATVPNQCTESEGNFTINVNLDTAGVAPYTYSFNGGAFQPQAAANFDYTNLSSGTYTIEVRDANGCGNLINVEIFQPTDLVPIVTVQPTCNNNDGVVTINVTGGSGVYEYDLLDGGGVSLTGGARQASNVFTGLAADSYTAVVFDIAGGSNCSANRPVDLEVPTAVNFTENVQDVSCNGGSDGSIEVVLDPTNDNPPYTYTLDDGTNPPIVQNSPLFSGLSAGSYDITVTSDRNCDLTRTVVVGEPAALTATAASTLFSCDPTDNTVNDAQITVTPAGGTAPYTYSIDGVNFVSSNVFDVSADATYTLTVRDANGCTFAFNEIIAPLQRVVIDNITSTQAINCTQPEIVEINVSGGSGNYEYILLPSGTPQASNQFTLTAPGVYSFQVNDLDRGCFAIESFEVLPFDLITVSAAHVSDVTCFGGTDGELSLTTAAYTGTYDYEVLDAGGAVVANGSGNAPETINIGGLGTGVYTVRVVETQNPFCEATTNVVTITSPDAAVAVTATATLANCNVGAIITPVGTGGNGTYEYSVVPQGNPAGAFTSATSFEVNPATYPATFTVFVRDAAANICTSSVDIVVDRDPDPTVTVPAFADDQCTSNGSSYTFTAVGTGVAPLEYSIDGVSFQSSASFTVSTDGTYTVTVRDANGCTATDTITIFPPVDMTASVTAEETCNPATDGEITLTASGGSGNYQYRITAPAATPFQASNVFGGLTAGTYTLEVEDTTTNCTDTVTITIDAPTPVAFTLTPTDVSCNGGSDGTITVNLDASNDEPPYLYSLDGGTTTQTSPLFTGLTAGPYNVTVISSKGCTLTVATNIGEPAALTATAASTLFSCDPTDNTVNDAQITVTPAGGTAPYTYSIDGVNFVSSNVFDVSADATYTLTVRDANGCTFAFNEIIAPLQRVVIDNITSTQAINCTQPEIVEINVSGGSGNYEYILLPSGTPQASNQFTLTAPGVYSFQVNDLDRGCFAIESFEVLPFDLITVSAAHVSDVTCFGGTDGELSLTTAAYTGTYDYEVLDAGGAVVANGSGNAPETINIGGLGTGVYTVRVVETQNPFCEATTNVVTITSPDAAVAVTATATLANCNVGAIITPVGTGGNGTYEYSVVPQGNPAGAFTSATSFEVNPATYPATFTVFVRDAAANICTSSVDIVVDRDPDPTVTVPAFADDQCTSNGSSYTFTAVGTGVAPLEYSIDGVSFQSSASFTVSTDGAYTVTVRDANGCTATDTITIFPPLDVVVDVTTQPSCANNDGSITATGSGGSGNTANYQYTLLDNGGAVLQGPNTTGVFTGLTGGVIYRVQFVDTTVGAPACIAEETITLEIPTPVTLLPTDVTDITCNGAADGTITVNLEPAPANDNPPYVFTVDNGTDPAITQNSGVFTGLNPGTYTITVTSNRNCVATDTVTIGEPLSLTGTASVTSEFACNPDNSSTTATITAVADNTTGTSATGGYLFSIDGVNFFTNGTNTYDFDVTAAGAYTITIQDDNACVFTVPVTVNPLTTFTLDAVTQITAITCANPEEVRVDVTGGSGDFTYEILPGGPVQVNNNLFTLTTPDSYTFRVTDNVTGCFETIVYDVPPFDLIEVSATKISDITCFGDADGVIELTVSNYTGTYDYEVLDQTSAVIANGNDVAPGTIQINNLPSGVYTVRVVETQTPFCEETTNVVTIDSPAAPLTLTLDVTNDLTCDGNDGEITAVATGGWAGYQFRLLRNGVETVPFGAATSFTGLDAATYTVEVRDANGCVVSTDQILVQPTQIVATAVQVDALVCAGDATASIEVTATGGRPDVDPTATYQYILNVLDPTTGTILSSSAAQSSNTFGNLSAGRYSVTVIDGWNCDVTTNEVIISDPAEVVATLVQDTSASCLVEATITLTASGGTAPYSYSTDGVNYTGSFASSITLPAPAGDYQFFVRDSNLCVSDISNQVSIDPVPALTIDPETTVDVGCNGESTGLIQVRASGGLGNYTFTLLASDQTTVIRPAQTEDIFRDLPAGQYFVRVDSGDCQALTQPITIIEGVELTAREPIIDNPLCVDDMGSITIILEGGTGQYQFAISPNLNEFQSENVFDNLAPGMYTIIAQDSNGCRPFIFEREIVAPAQVAGTVANMQGELCAGDLDGFIEVNITGGTAPYFTRLVSSPDNPLTFDPNFVQDQFTFTGLAGGYSYVVLVRDANGCESQIAMDLPAGININAAANVETVCTGNLPSHNVTITVDPSVQNDVMFAMDSMDNNDLQLFDPNGFQDVAPGAHFVRVVHANGCEEIVNFTIDNVAPLGITATQGLINEIVASATGGVEPYEYFFNGVSNGSSNSFFVNQTGTYEVRVVDANGCEAVTSIFIEFIDIFIPNFFTPDGDGTNDTWSPKNTEPFPDILTQIFDRYGRLIAELRQGESWLGTYNGNPLPSGDYWYVVKLNASFDGREFVGNFTLYR
ncbi:T9SS type B sorting domain-containing protein [Leptobacterium flavescens]|uniref:T9SS type B sorting domain-containing protein n=1 Tax=Leptobacterium flavescens TaxID=472055 RepID=UPI001953FD43|nr:T9SS type B sorting domain-containing protein [Leptobacterium flavescens]